MSTKTTNSWGQSAEGLEFGLIHMCPHCQTPFDFSQERDEHRSNILDIMGYQRDFSGSKGPTVIVIKCAEPLCDRLYYVDVNETMLMVLPDLCPQWPLEVEAQKNR